MRNMGKSFPLGRGETFKSSRCNWRVLVFSWPKREKRIPNYSDVIVITNEMNQAPHSSPLARHRTDDGRESGPCNNLRDDK